MQPISTEAQTPSQSSTAFLEELESKHNHVLTELDRLNERIEKVLAMYQSGRQASASGPAQQTKAA